MERTMNIALMENLLASTESATCDFKKEIYNMEEENGRISFLKDILSMANTIREESAYIIIGVQQKDGHNIFQDVDMGIDENVFLTFLKSNIDPRLPLFSYYQFKYKKYVLGIFEIGIGTEGPYYSKKDYGDKIRKNCVYFRYSSSNHEADERDLSEISAWMHNIPSDDYKILFNDLEHFNTDAYNYVLFLGNDTQKLCEKHYALLGKIKWSLIVDMQRCSETNGFYHHAAHRLANKVSIHTLTTEECRIQTFSEGKTLLWFLCGGEQSKNNFSITAREWRREYFRKVDSVLAYINQNAKKPIVYVSLLGDDDVVSIVENMVGGHENEVLFGKYVTIQWKNKFFRKEDSGFIIVQGSLRGIFSAFSLVEEFESRVADEMYRLPDGAGGSKEVKNRSWLDEELEPLYENVSSVASQNRDEEVRNFFCGGIIPWNMMNPCIAVKREIYDDLMKTIENLLSHNSHRANIVRFKYQAGAGATTVARMLAWHFHSKYPVIILHKYSAGTVERLKSIYTDTEKCVMLIIIDKMTIDEQIVEDIKQALRVEQVQAIILYVKRYLHSLDQKDAVNTHLLLENLNRKEREAFVQCYMQCVDMLDVEDFEKQRRKDALITMSMDTQLDQTPFLYALTSYELHFNKIEDYVASHLCKMDQDQEKLFRLLSVVQVYAGCEVPLFVLQQKTQLAIGRFRIENMLTPDQKTLLMRSATALRTIHYCVAKGILQYICGLHMKNKTAWRNNLQEVLSQTVQDLQPYHEHVEVSEIIQKIFLQQTDTKIKGGHFADAIEELGTPEAKGEIFNLLCSAFPENPYVYSNRARYYHFLIKDEGRALIEINQALQLKEDYTFFHIKGIILAKQFLYFIENDEETIKKTHFSLIDELNNVKKAVFAAFNQSIALKYNNTYAYTDKIRFCFNVIRKMKEKIYPGKAESEFLKYEKFYWYMELIDDIQSVLEEMRALQDYADIDLASEIENYHSQLLKIKGYTNAAIEGWNNLLIKQDVYRPVIRRLLVEGYSDQCKGDWKKLNKKKQEYVCKILEDNIAEERDDPRNVLKWFCFIRQFEGNLEKAVHFFSMELLQDYLLYSFYAMVVSYVYTIKNQDGIFMEMAQRCAKKCENLARDFPNRGAVKEFYDPNREDVLSIVSYQSLRDARGGFDDVLMGVTKIQGRILRIDKPESGVIQIENMKIHVKFNPSHKSNNTYKKGRDENKRVEFVLGFRYEGAYAYSVTSL